MISRRSSAYSSIMRSISAVRRDAGTGSLLPGWLSLGDFILKASADARVCLLIQINGPTRADEVPDCSFRQFVAFRDLPECREEARVRDRLPIDGVNAVVLRGLQVFRLHLLGVDEITDSVEFG